MRISGLLKLSLATLVSSYDPHQQRRTVLTYSIIMYLYLELRLTTLYAILGSLSLPRCLRCIVSIQQTTGVPDQTNNQEKT